MSTMVEILRRIIDTKGAGCVLGLCAELKQADDYDEELIDSLFETWEHFSGSRVYPVPNPKHPGDPAEAGAVFQDLREYGEQRLKLARSASGRIVRASGYHMWGNFHQKVDRGLDRPPFLNSRM